MNFKVKCVHADAMGCHHFTVGEIYEVTDKGLKTNQGQFYTLWRQGDGDNNFEKLKKWFANNNYGCDYTFELVEDKEMFTKSDLKTGMFGYFKGEEEDWFVVVGDKLVYEKGAHDCLTHLKFDDNMVTTAGRKLMAVYNACCFNAAKGSNRELIWERNGKKPLYNGKVVCVDLNGRNSNLYTVGKIYQFEDGNLTANNGEQYPGTDYKVYSFEDWTKWTSSKFIEIKE